MRLRLFEREYLFVQPSLLRSHRPASFEFDVPIGNGLFTAKCIRKGQIIAYFMGDIIPTLHNEVLVATKPERDGYQVQLTKHYILDCYDYKEMCLASMANDYRGCFDYGRNGLATPNATLHCANRKDDGFINRYAYLKASEDIEAWGEVITYYGRNYDIQGIMNPEPLFGPVELIDLSFEDPTDDVLALDDEEIEVPGPEIIDLSTDSDSD